MSNTVQLASIAAWQDEAHVAANRGLYREKFAAFHALVHPVLPLAHPDAGFYFWADVGGDDAAFARELFAATHVTVLPGSYICARGPRREPGARLRAHRARVHGRGRARGGPAHPRLRHPPRAGARRGPCAMSELQATIEQAFERRAELSPASAPAQVQSAVAQVLAGLDAGRLRVAEKRDGQWITHQWLKMAVLLSFRLRDNGLMQGGYTHYFDKVGLEVRQLHPRRFPGRRLSRRAPGERAPRRVHREERRADALLREHRRVRRRGHDGRHLGHRGLVRADRASNVHLSGGVGIGGVLEPLQANPTIIEDDCFIGARSEIVEGVIVGEGSVVSMGVYIGQSTKIYNRATGEVSYGKIPPGSVVVSGSLPGGDGRYSLYCAVIIKQVDAKTRAKTGINELLRGD